MKKLFVMLISAFLLCGCVDTKTIADDIQDTLLKVNKMERIPGSNMNKYYYNYYLPAQVKRIESNEMSEVFQSDGYDIIMNFDTSAIIINNYYNETSKTSDATGSASPALTQKELQNVEKKIGKDKTMVFSGRYENSVYQDYPYTLTIAQGTSEDYVMHLDGTVVDFYSVIPAAKVNSTIKIMMKIAKSLRFERDLVLRDFSMRRAQQNKKQNLDYLSEKYPEEGYLIEIEDHRETTSPD